MAGNIDGVGNGAPNQVGDEINPNDDLLNDIATDDTTETGSVDNKEAADIALRMSQAYGLDLNSLDPNNPEDAAKIVKYAILDRNGDGGISIFDFGMLINDVAAVNENVGLIEQTITDIDADQDGVISQAEVARTYSEYKQAINGNQELRDKYSVDDELIAFTTIESIFATNDQAASIIKAADAMDPGRDGFLSWNDVVDTYNGILQGWGQGANVDPSIIARFDFDGDGVVSMNDFRIMALVFQNSSITMISEDSVAETANT